ncbi:helix-turn-helix domain-containing protein [Acinetobacter tandoii]|nr:helix-turn-helix domain-containing protein [Acinetobacter tandoii]
MSTTKLNSMTISERITESERFHLAAECETFSPEIIAIVLGVSLSWLQKKRCEGGGIPYSKIHYRKIVYRKSDVISYINSQITNSTSQYRAV